MKRHLPSQGDTTPTPEKPPSISIAEIALVIAYFLAVWLIPESWLDTAVGAIAFSIASKVNPYLSDYSIAFAQNPQYFIHCHVLSTWMISPLMYPLIVRRNGGKAKYAMLLKTEFERFGSATCLIVLQTIFFASCYFGMIQLVDYPLTKGEWAIWIGGVSVSALMMAGIPSLWIGAFYMTIYTHQRTDKGVTK